MAFEIFKMMGVISLNKEQALKDIKAVQTQAQTTATAMGQSFKKAGQYITDHSATFRKMGMAMTVVGGVIALAVKNVGKAFDEYETKLVDMGKVTDESLDVIQDRIRGMPPILGSATQLLSGYYQVVSAGVKDTAEAMEVLTVSAQTASAAHIEQSQVVEGITKMMAGYEGSIKDASDAADLLFAIEKEGQVTVAGLIPIIGGLAKVSFDLNISQQEMGASMAVISKTAGSASEAGTQYEAVISGLMKPTEEMTTAFNNMGFATAEAAIEELGLVEVLRNLDKATGGSSEALGKLFGRKEAMVGFSALSAQGFKVLDDTIVSVGESTGSAQKAFDDWSKTGEALDKVLANTTQNLKIMIGEALDPMMDKLQTWLIKVVTGISEWVKANPELTRTIAVWTAGIGGALLVLGPLVALLPSLVAGLHLIVPAIVALGTATVGPLGILIIAVGLAAIGLKKLSEHLKGVREEAYKTKVGLEKMNLAQLDAEIAKLIDEATKLQGAFSGIDWGIENAEIATIKSLEYEASIAKVNEQLGILYKKREELIKVEEKGIDVTEEVAKIQDEINKILDESTKKIEENTEAVEEQKDALAELLVGSKLVEAQIANINSQYELTNKTAEQTVDYYNKLIEKYKQLIIQLEKEQKTYKEGTVGHQNYTDAIYAAELKIKDLTNATEELYKVESEALKGLELTTAQLGVLENKYSDVTKGQEYFTEKAELLKKEYQQLNEELKRTEFHSAEWFNLTNRLYDNEEAARKLKEEWEELNIVQSDALTGIELVNAELILLEARFGSAAKSEEYVIQKTTLLNEKYRLLNEALASTEFHSAEWFELTQNIIAVGQELDNLDTAVDDSKQRWIDFFSDLKTKYGDTIGSIQTGISNFVSSFQTGLSNAITSLLTMAETNAKIKEDMAAENETYLAAVSDANEANAAEELTLTEAHNATLMGLNQTLNDAIIAGDQAAVDAANLAIADEEEKFATAMESMKTTHETEMGEVALTHQGVMDGLTDDLVTPLSIWKTFWTAMKTAAINALAEMIAKAALFALLSMGWAGWIILGIAVIAALVASAGKSLGGEVEAIGKSLGGIIKDFQFGGKIEKYDIGGRIKRMEQIQSKMEYFQAGGPKGTDTVPAWLTPGEYVIAKPMTDFIRRTGAITGDLIRSIQSGSRTPSPGFAAGGLVGAGAGSSIELNIMPGAIMINTKTLDDRAISQAGTKLFAEFEKQARNAGKILVGR